MVECNLPLSTGDHVAKLFRSIFPNSKIYKYQCGCPKTTHVLTGAVPKLITGNLKAGLLLSHWYRLATHGTSNENDKF